MTTNLLAEPGVEELRRRLLATVVGEAGIDLRRHPRVRVPGERGRLGERRASVEGERDERIAEVVKADALAAVAV